ncbi:MAG: hypothetical protein ACP5OE_09910 [Thermodesulfobium sp.]
MRTWTRFLEKRGYEVEYGKFEYWIDVMWTIKGKERIPIAITGGDGNRYSIIKHYEIAVSEKNFDILRRWYLESKSDQIPDYPIVFRMIQRKDGKYTLKEIFNL